MRSAVVAALVLVAAVWSHDASADESERIKLFRSEIDLATNGALSVRETITIHAEGREIRRGIYRDFPTTYRDRAGNRVRVRFDVRDVQRDGATEPYALESLSNGVRVRIGDADVFLDRGEHTYVIVYETDRQVGFFENFDEIYWNVTGNGWVFAIERAEAVIHLPPGAHIEQYASYTGPQGAAGTMADQSFDATGTIRFWTTRPLGAEEGLTVAVGFTKGVVRPPTEGERAAEFARDNAGAGAAILGLIALAVFYGIAWWRFGRDPARGVVIPRFEPPRNFPPAAARFVRRMGYDRKAFAAALVDMAVKGYHVIEEERSVYTLRRTGKSEAETGLSEGERALAKALFGGGKAITLKNTNHDRVSRAIGALRTVLRRQYETVYFVKNRGWFLGGIAILAVSATLAAILSEGPEEAIFLLIWLSVWSTGTSALVYWAFVGWRGVFAGPGSRIRNFLGALFMTAFAIPFVGGLAAALFFLGETVTPVTMIALAASGVLAFVFYHLLKAPTLAGARARDEIDGLRMFLDTAEKERLEVLHPPEVTPEVFERFLPYAIALDAENAWSRKFAEEAAKAGHDTDSYSPHWYSGPSYSRLGAAGFASAIGSSVASAAASAATAPGSSSGSGGGGSSGGGGGGGGGGGW